MCETVTLNSTIADHWEYALHQDITLHFNTLEELKKYRASAYAWRARRKKKGDNKYDLLGLMMDSKKLTLSFIKPHVTKAAKRWKNYNIKFKERKEEN